MRLKSARKPGLLALLALPIILATLAACGGGEDAPAEASQVTLADETSQATPADEASSAASPVTTSGDQTQDSSGMSLDEYLTAVCGGQAELAAWEEDVSLREISSGLGQHIEAMESLEPPSEVSDWHDAGLEFQRAFKRTVDDYLEDSEGQTEDEFLFSMFLTLASDFEAVERAIAGMDPEVRSRMAQAGCIDEETTTTTPSIEAEEISVGDILTGSLEPEEANHFVFQAEMGQRYLIEVAWDEVQLIFFRLHDPQNPLDYGEVTDISPIVRRWTAPESGAFNIEVRNQGAFPTAATYTISLSIDASPDSPAGVSASWEGLAVEISWDPVQGAEYYKVYYDISSFCYDCEELAANVVVASYTHASPDLLNPNHYWVVACNQGGCSAIDAENPATPGDRPAPPSPTNQRSAPLGAGWQVLITWDAVDGADFYRVYYNNQPSCSIGGSGSSSCEELTSPMGERHPSYTHVLDNSQFDPLKDYYWVVACTRAGCSEVDSENPATPEEG